MWVSDHICLPVPLHQHDYYQLVYCQKGVGKITVGETVYNAVPGRGYLIKPMEEHDITPKELFRLAEVKFTVEDPALDSGLRQLPTELEIDEHASLRLSLKDVIREGLADAMYSHEATNAALCLFLIRLLRKNDVAAVHEPWRSFYFDAPKRRAAGDDPERALDFSMVIDYIERHLSEPITLEDLAKVVHFEKSYLATQFKKLWGISPIRYVNYVRIERAKALLAATDKSVTQIASEVGFASIHYFCRYFKEKEKLTPNEYRLQRQKTMAPLVQE